VTPTPPPSPSPPASTSDAPPPARRAGAGRSARAWLLLLLSIVLAVAVDLGSKSVAFSRVAGAPVEIRRTEVMAVAADDPRAVGTLIPPHRPVVAVPRLLEFTLVLNPGAVFGVGPGQRWFFIGFTAVALGFGLWMFARWTRAGDTWAHIGIGLLIGGGLGNLYDRLVYGVVRDFLHPLPGLKWPFGLRPLGPSGEIWPYVSNVADALLLIGIGILLVYLWRRERAERAAAAKPAASQVPTGAP
jgi:signal peptidase II